MHMGKTTDQLLEEVSGNFFSEVAWISDVVEQLSTNGNLLYNNTYNSVSSAIFFLDSCFINVFDDINNVRVIKFYNSSYFVLNNLSTLGSKFRVTCFMHLNSIVVACVFSKT